MHCLFRSRINQRDQGDEDYQMVHKQTSGHSIMDAALNTTASTLHAASSSVMIDILPQIYHKCCRMRCGAAMMLAEQRIDMCLAVSPGEGGRKWHCFGQ